MRPALQTQLGLGLSGASDSQFGRVCNDDSDGVTLWWSDPDRDTSGGAQSCVKIHAFCLGKADSVDGEAPPYETLDGSEPAAAAGCSFGGATTRTSATGILLIAALFGLCLGPARSRRGRRS